jgi:hypothetical protein
LPTPWAARGSGPHLLLLLQLLQGWIPLLLLQLLQGWIPLLLLLLLLQGG